MHRSCSLPRFLGESRPLCPRCFLCRFRSSMVRLMVAINSSSRSLLGRLSSARSMLASLASKSLSFCRMSTGLFFVCLLTNGCVHLPRPGFLTPSPPAAVDRFIADDKAMEKIALSNRGFADDHLVIVIAAQYLSVSARSTVGVRERYEHPRRAIGDLHLVNWSAVAPINIYKSTPELGSEVTGIGSNRDVPINRR